MEKISYEQQYPTRIDVYLTWKFGYSRNFFQHLFERGWISVNWKKVKKSYKLKKDDQIEIDNLERYTSPVIMEEAPAIELEIKKEKKDYLVIYKPKDVLSHPGSIWEVSTPSVVGFLYHKYKNLPTVSNFIRAGLVHRLDKQTDWFMIIAKTEKGLSHFKNLFQEKSLSETIEEKEKTPLHKKYSAVCYITEEWKQFIEEIWKSLPHFIQEPVRTKWLKEHKEGITKILNFHTKDNQTCSIELEILTWRTHQIRYHLANKGLPVRGDYVYWNKNSKKASQLHLTNSGIEFLDNENEYIKIS